MTSAGAARPARRSWSPAAATSALSTRPPASEPEVLRRRAFLALKEIFARLSEERPIVVTIDDLQWGDADSGLVLTYLTSPPDPPPLLFIGSYRAQDIDRSELLRLLRESTEGKTVKIVLGPLDDATAEELARRHGAPDRSARTASRRTRAAVRSSSRSSRARGTWTRRSLRRTAAPSPSPSSSAGK